MGRKNLIADFLGHGDATEAHTEERKFNKKLKYIEKQDKKLEKGLINEKRHKDLINNIKNLK